MFGASDEENPPMQVTLSQRFNKLSGATFSSTSDPTAEQTKAYNIIFDELSGAHSKTRQILDADIARLHKLVDMKNIPATPYRLPDWKK